MISDLDETIRQLLIRKGGLDPTEIDIVFEMPDREWSGSISKPTINIYLYDMHENRELRDNRWAVAHHNGMVTRAKRPLRVDISYLVTVWTNDAADQHRLLGHILTVLLRFPELPRDILHGTLAEMDKAIPTWTAQPDGVLRNSADFWSALDNQLKPSINYVVTLPIDIAVAETAPEITARTFKFTGKEEQVPEETILISGVVHRKGDPDDVIPEVRVIARELQRTATTNEEGIYAFRRMRPGAHTFEVVVPGEKTREVSVTIPSARYDIEI